MLRLRSKSRYSVFVPEEGIRERVKVKIKLHTMYFLPEFGSAPILMDELASYLSSKGHDVEVVTTMPRGMGIEKPKKSGSPAGYSQPFEVKRFRVCSVSSPLGRLFAWCMYGLFSAWNVLFSGKSDIFFMRLPPLPLGIAAVLSRKLKGTKVVISLQDIHPDLAIESGILRNNLLIKLAYAFERWVYRHSDLIVVISEGFKNNILRKGIDSAKIKVIPNWVNTEFIRPLEKDVHLTTELQLNDKFVVMYAGTISLSSFTSLNLIIEAAALLREEKDIAFVIVGSGLKKADLEEKVTKLGLTNIKFIPFLPYRKLPLLFAAADLLLVPVDKNKAELSVPSKLYNCMASGKPVICLAPEDSEIYNLVKETGSGISIEPEDSKKIRDSIIELKKMPERARSMGINARDYVVKHFSAGKILNEYDQVLKEVRR